jgi:hypothetical protein
MIVEGSLMAAAAKVAADSVKTAGEKKRKRSSYAGFQSPPQAGK